MIEVLEIEKLSLSIIRKLSVWMKGKLQTGKNIYNVTGQ